ncbi:unnamed protein product [Dibothriocephalus latus]|uniref:Uncharacterized protein n=1 Tax=Dibothriocephalus latus TaxID=60516 RepID=A0A3P7NCK4_DIBLA|nr:unnamed protein product [Dibothriocephalus latus]
MITAPELIKSLDNGHGKVSGEALLSSVDKIGLTADKVRSYVDEHKDAKGMLDARAVTTYLGTLH